MPPIRKYGGQPAVEKEAFALKPGELSGIIATGGKYLILRCQGFTEPIVSDPNAVRSELVRDLTESKTNRAMADRFENLIESSEIDNFLEAEANPRVADQALKAEPRLSPRLQKRLGSAVSAGPFFVGLDRNLDASARVTPGRCSLSYRQCLEFLV